MHLNCQALPVNRNVDDSTAERVGGVATPAVSAGEESQGTAVIGSLGESVEDVPGDPFHDVVAAAEAVSPVRRADSEDGPSRWYRYPARPRRGRGAGRVAGEAVVPEGVVRMPAGRARGQDDEAFGRAVAVGRHGQAILRVRTHSRRIRSPRPCAWRRTRRRASSLVPSKTQWSGRWTREGPLAVHELAVAEVIAAVEEPDPGELILGPPHEVVAPEGRQGAVVVRREDRVLVEPLLPAGQGAAVLLAAHLPAAGIAAEECDVASPADERLEVVAHRGRPVFVVADAEDQLVTSRAARDGTRGRCWRSSRACTRSARPRRRTAAPTGGTGPSSGRLNETRCPWRLARPW